MSLECQPKDIFYKITKELEIRDILNLSQVNRKFKERLNQEYWKLKIMNDFKLTSIQIEKCQKDYQKFYLYLYENKKGCEYYIRRYYTYNDGIFLMQSITSSIEEYYIFKYLKEKLFYQEVLQNNPYYFITFYNSEILPLVQKDKKYNFITVNANIEERKEFVSQMEMEYFFKLLKELLEKVKEELIYQKKRYFEDSFYDETWIKINIFVLAGIVEKRIPLDVKINEIYHYPLFINV
jgi:hypothetical protein